MIYVCLCFLCVSNLIVVYWMNKMSKRISTLENILGRYLLKISEQGGVE